MSRQKAKEVVEEAPAVAVEEGEEDCGPLSITKLEASGITAAEIKKLKECGFHTIESVAFTTRKTLLGHKFSEIKADKIINEGKRFSYFPQTSSYITTFF